MGFRLNKSYTLKFEGDMEGAEVKLRTTSVGTMLKLRNLHYGNPDELYEAATLLADHVVGWNLDDEKGEPVALTAEAILAGVEEPVLSTIFVEWAKAAVGVTAPLDEPSTSGEQYPEGNIPMAAL